MVGGINYEKSSVDFCRGNYRLVIHNEGFPQMGGRPLGIKGFDLPPYAPAEEYRKVAG
jgi:hypothetical protein